MAINTLLVRSYASNVYLSGRNSFSNIGFTRPEYVEPVMQYAASTFHIEDVDNTLTKGWISPEEHADTLALKTADDPQNRPPFEFAAPELIVK